MLYSSQLLKLLLFFRYRGSNPYTNQQTL